jgi:hypothetical protein
MYSYAVFGGEFLSKINPGRDREDNDLRTARAGGMQDVEIPEARMVGNSYQCPMCSKFFKNREEYLSHAMAKHQPVTKETTMGAKM